MERRYFALGHFCLKIGPDLIGPVWRSVHFPPKMSWPIEFNQPFDFCSVIQGHRFQLNSWRVKVKLREKKSLDLIAWKASAGKNSASANTYLGTTWLDVICRAMEQMLWNGINLKSSFGWNEHDGLNGLLLWFHINSTPWLEEKSLIFFIEGSTVAQR